MPLRVGQGVFCPVMDLCLSMSICMESINTESLLVFSIHSDIARFDRKLLKYDLLFASALVVFTACPSQSGSSSGVVCRLDAMMGSIGMLLLVTRCCRWLRFVMLSK